MSESVEIIKGRGFVNIPKVVGSAGVGMKAETRYLSEQEKALKEYADKQLNRNGFTYSHTERQHVKHSRYTFIVLIYKNEPKSTQEG